MEYIDPSVRQEEAYDQYDQKGMHNAFEIRERTDYETDGTNEDFSAAAIRDRLGDVAVQSSFSENQKGGLDHKAWSEATQDSEQQKTVQEQIARLREEVRKANPEQPRNLGE